MNTLFDTSPVHLEQTVILHFDGGTPCNHPKNYGIGYGSYSFNGGSPYRVNHGVPCSNNAAEVLTLCVALEELAKLVQPQATEVKVWADSQIAIKWLRVAAGDPSGGFKRRSAKLSKGSSELFRQSIARLAAAAQPFAKIEAVWKERSHAVAAFGH